MLTGHKAAALALADGPPAEIRYILFDRVSFVGAQKSPTRPFQVLAYKCLSIDQLAIWTFNNLNSAVLPAL